MVEVAFGGGHRTSGESTGRIPGLDMTFETGGGTAAGGPIPEDLSGFGVGDGDPMFRVGLFSDDLAGDV